MHTLDTLQSRYLSGRTAFYPNAAAAAGLHQFDGGLTDLSVGAVEPRVAELQALALALAALPPPPFDSADYLVHQGLQAAIGEERYRFETRRVHRTDPLAFTRHLSVGAYAQRHYAPWPERAQGLCAHLESIPQAAGAILAQLEPSLPRPWLDTAIEVWGGMASFYRGELTRLVRAEGSATPEVAPELGPRLHKAIEAAATALDNVTEAFQVEFIPRAHNRFALGARDFMAMLEASELVPSTLDRLEAVARADLEHNLCSLRERLAQWKPGVPEREVIAELFSDHPAASDLVETTAEITETVRHWVEETGFVRLPSPERCQVTETPEFMRWAVAAMNTPGAFEQVATESYYYVTPVDPKWSPDQQEEWLSQFAIPTLHIISLHEAYPGHYVQHLHAQECKSPLAGHVGSYAFTEGWAHYVEEAALDYGYGDGDPGLRVVQLVEALIRNCRFLCAIGMHTRGMSVDDATNFFRQNAFLGELPARKEAQRGTFDPGYGNYTLGKLMVRRLRSDLDTRGPLAPAEFHDRLLAHGRPPLPALRAHLLGRTEGPLV